MSLYSQRGVSAQKEEVHAATKNLDKGLYPHAFCKIYGDTLGGDKDWVNVMHADGAGTKSILAYLYWKETGDISIWKGIAQDAIMMNLDDLICTGIYDNILFSSTIDRNKKLIPGEVLEVIINGTNEIFNWLKEYGINIQFLGGETADVGDVVRTIAVNGTMTARWPKSKLVTNYKIQPGDVIVGFASYGQATYEDEYNSGIGSNGLTSARHDILEKWYAENYPESFEPSLNDEVVYIGKHKLTDEVKDYEQLATGNEQLAIGNWQQATNNQQPATGNQQPVAGKRQPATESSTNIGKLILSPTRTYAPLVKKILESHFENIHGMIHCSGGGQTKCMKYLPGPMKVVKDNLFAPPLIFKLIQEASKSSDEEMYQVFNMGHRLEIFTNEKTAEQLIALSNKFGIQAKIIGRVEHSETSQLLLKGNFGEIVY
jgi:phosphoribosylformylglycinamidine cyclo-ligase